ncbi:hypothetical protein TPY_0680 [Sulfobacillus acidophilus TPY]|nr:hypothetical protein TPY_0680 [Sulfobacillus acidophilus TPY]
MALWLSLAPLVLNMGIMAWTHNPRDLAWGGLSYFVIAPGAAFFVRRSIRQVPWTYPASGSRVVPFRPRHRR